MGVRIRVARHCSLNFTIQEKRWWGWRTYLRGEFFDGCTEDKKQPILFNTRQEALNWAIERFSGCGVLEL